MRSTLIQIVIVAFIGLTSWYIWDNWDSLLGQSNANQNNKKAERPPTAVDAKSVRIDKVVVKIEVVGNLKASDAIDITTEVSGIIKNIKFVEGETVEKNEILLVLDSKIEQAEVERWSALLERRKRLLASAEKLSKTNNIAKTKVDQLATDVSEAIAELTIAKAKLNKKVIKAPFAGMIGLNNISIGEYLEPGEIATTLDATNPIELDFEVPESAISTLKIGTKVSTYTRAWGEELFTGKIKSINSRVNKESRSITVRAQIKNLDSRLKPGMFMIVKLPIFNRKEAIIIPEEAVIADGTQRTVYTIEEGRAKARSVKLGERFFGEVEVTSGLEETSIVIVGGIQKVRDGTKVTIRNAVDQ